MNHEIRFSNKITKVSFWLAICVVFIHANNTTTYQFDLSKSFDKYVYLFENWGQGWQQCAVPMFFIISGFLFFKNYSSDKLLSKWKSRCKTLLIPYLIWTQIPWFLLSAIKLTTVGNAINLNASFTLESWLDFVIYCNGTVLWYVRATMLYVLLAPLIYAMMSHKKIGLAMIFSIIGLNIALIMFRINIQEELYWFPPFLLGSWLGIWKQDWFKKRVEKNKRLVALLIFIILLIIALDYKHTLHTPLTQYLYKLALPLPLWFALDIFDFEKKPNWVEKLSFPLYCTHAILLESIEKIIFILGGNLITIAIGVYILIPIVVVGILIIFFYYFNKLFPKIYRVTFGCRG